MFGCLEGRQAFKASSTPLAPSLWLPTRTDPIIPTADKGVSTTMTFPATRQATEKPHQLYGVVG